MRGYLDQFIVSHYTIVPRRVQACNEKSGHQQSSDRLRGSWHGAAVHENNAGERSLRGMCDGKWRMAGQYQNNAPRRYPHRSSLGSRPNRALSAGPPPLG